MLLRQSLQLAVINSRVRQVSVVELANNQARHTEKVGRLTCSSLCLLRLSWPETWSPLCDHPSSWPSQEDTFTEPLSYKCCR